MDEIKKRKPLGKKTYVDGLGYMRFNDSDLLVSRWVAKKEIYDKDRRKYPLKFGSYVVHHKNGDKLDNSVENLEVVKRREHKERHGIENYKNKFKVVLIVCAILIVVIWSLVFILGYFQEEDRVESVDVVCDFDSYDCVDFDSCEEARFVFDSCENDIHFLDGDRNNIPCEDLCG